MSGKVRATKLEQQNLNGCDEKSCERDVDGHRRALTIDQIEKSRMVDVDHSKRAVVDVDQEKCSGRRRLTTGKNRKVKRLGWGVATWFEESCCVKLRR